MFYKIENASNESDNLLSAENKINLANSLLKGGIVKTGIGLAMSAGLQQSAKEQTEETKKREISNKLERMIKVGDKKLLYRNYSCVDTFYNTHSDEAYLRFVPIGVPNNNIYECEYFFFNKSNKTIKQRIENIKTIIGGKIESISNQNELDNEVEKNVIDESDSFEKIRKYKQLLDEGIITEEEFQKKKKELLDL